MLMVTASRGYQELFVHNASQHHFILAYENVIRVMQSGNDSTPALQQTSSADFLLSILVYLMYFIAYTVVAD